MARLLVHVHHDALLDLRQGDWLVRQQQPECHPQPAAQEGDDHRHRGCPDRVGLLRHRIRAALRGTAAGGLSAFLPKSDNLEVAPGTCTYKGSVNFRQNSVYHVEPIHLRKSMRRPPLITLYNPGTGLTNSWHTPGGVVPVSSSGSDTGENYFYVAVSSSGTDQATLSGHWTADAEFNVP